MMMVLAVAMTLVAAPRAAVAQATSEVERRDIQVTGDQPHPCSGDLVTFSGFITVTTRTTVDARGITHVAYNMVPHLEASTPSAEYKINGVDRYHETTDVEGTTVQSYTSGLLLIGQGKAPNYKEKYVARITISPDGSFEIQFEHNTAGCV